MNSSTLSEPPLSLPTFDPHHTSLEGSIIVQKTREYYKHIDNGNVDFVLSLFARDATYKRGESFFADFEEIDYFFRNQRKITGQHMLKKILLQDQLVVVKGDFLGKGADNLPRHVEFCDFWEWNKNLKVQNRQTFLALGSHYVR